MKKALLKKITRIVADLCIKSNYGLRGDMLEALRQAERRETERLPRIALGKLIENVRIAKKEKIPLCQDTGMAEVFLEIGKGARVEGNALIKAVNDGVGEGYKKGYLRKSVVADPLFLRKNTGDNTPALIHFLFDSSWQSKIKITLFPKGFGSENMARATMLTPAEGKRGVKKFVLDTVKKAGANPCPPIIVGIGIGGTMATSTFLAKKALLRPLRIRNSQAEYAFLEKELLREINELRIGVEGLGGITTCLGVNIEHFPTHLAGLPVGVNISCYALRQTSAVLEV